MKNQKQNRYTKTKKREILAFAKKNTVAAAVRKFKCAKVSIHRWKNEIRA